MTVEIIGRACVAPVASSPKALFELLRRGQCAISSIPSDRWDRARFWHPNQGVPGKTYTFAAGVLDRIYDFDAAAFGLSQREAMSMDPQQRILLQLAWRALEDANISLSSLRRDPVGVYVGASGLDNGNMMVEDPAAAGPYFMTGNTLSIVSNRISHIFGISGPTMTVDTACSSSLVALHQAVEALNEGTIETAIVGGVNILTHPLPFVGFAQARMLSPEGLCRAYDNDGVGYVRAEGAVVLVLRRTDSARRQGDRSHARILATGVNSAGRTNGISMPSRDSQAELLRRIYSGDQIDANQVAFIEGHGTGTKVGDPAEVWSIGTVIGANRNAPVPIGSIKTNIGHTEPASGLFGVLKAVMALENNFLPASLHFDTPNENIDFDGLNVRVASSPIELLRGKRPRLAGINSFGFGGANAHAVISDPERPSSSPRQAEASATGNVFMASAHTASSLEVLLSSYRKRLTGLSASEARTVIASSGANRSQLQHRFVVRSDQPGDVVRAIASHLQAPGSDIGETGEAVVPSARIAFVFSGNGSQWAGMGVDAFRENAHFRQIFTSVSSLFRVHSDIVLTDLLTAPDLETRLRDTKVAQPLLFAIQAALSDSLVSMGIRPRAVFGHSIGEIAAAYAAGALGLVDAVSIVAKRSLHQDLLAGQGTMAAVMLGEVPAAEFAVAAGLDGICVAAVNAHNSVTISGTVDDIAAYRAAARKAKIPVQILDIDYPFHHPIIDRAKAAFLSDLPDIAPRKSDLVFLSTVTGESLDGAQLNSAYWWKNVREPVRFQAATEAAIALGCTLFVEISPRPILSSYVKETLKKVSAPGAAMPTLLRETTHKGHDPVSRTMARALAHGAAIDNERIFGRRNAEIALPMLPFEPVDLRYGTTNDGIDIFGRGNLHPYTLAGWRTDGNSGSWKNLADAHLFPDLAQHVVDGKPILPGSGFIEIAICAVRDYYGSEGAEITNLDILRPLELGDDRVSELSTILSPETGDIEIRSRERLSSDEWIVHAVARCRKPLPASAGRPAIARAAGKPVTVLAEQAYETARQFGLDYGPSFRLMTKARAYGKHLVEVDLRVPEAPGHPYLTYTLNPISVDATFHGLVAMFAGLTGERGGAPYIPVRFGAVRLLKAGAVICRANVEIERFSANSIRAAFRFFDDKGETVAEFDDCRFRRTYLRQHKTIDRLSFHYEGVVSDVALSAVERPSPEFPALLLPHTAGTGIDTAGLLLNAAVYRACHDVAMRLSKGGERIDGNSLPGDTAFRCFLVNCLYTLEDSGLAQNSGDVWSITRDPSLPPVAEILREVYAERADRMVEAVLINDSHIEALVRLDALMGQSPTDAVMPASGELTSFVSEATIEHHAMHSGLSHARMDLVLRTLAAALTGADGACRSLKIAEIGTVSAAFTRRLAALASLYGSGLVVIEPRENARRTLEIAFEADAHVDVVAPEMVGRIARLDIVVSASNELRPMLEDDASIRTLLRSVLRPGGAVIAAVDGPGIFADFAFGLSDAWFARSQTPEFPVGARPSAAHWSGLLADVGLEPVAVQDIELPNGAIVAMDARLRKSATLAEPDGRDADLQSVLVLHCDDLPMPRLLRMLLPVRLSGDGDADDTLLDGTFGQLEGERPCAVFVAGTLSTGETDGGSLRLQKNVLALSAFAKSAQRHISGPSGGALQRIRLVIVAPGGAPVRTTNASNDSANAGLWAFARVLRNEFPFLDIDMIDLPHASDAPLETALAILDGEAANREWVFSETSGTAVEVRAVPGPVSQRLVTTTAFPSATIRQRVSSQVASIAWEVCDLPEPGPGEVVIGVAATGLNFRDVMWAMGLLPEEALEDGFAGATIGMELSGHVVATGSGVIDIEVGDAVMAIAPAAFSTHAVVAREGVAKLPAGVSLVAAATVPVAFLTAYYAIVELGRVNAGETILIHGAAGGVGLAALQVAKLKGATVIATAGTLEKRRFLTMLGADHVFDSRTLDFVADIRAVTGGHGVDLVLNSLFGEAMEQSLQLVRPFGRFLELGKRDYYADSKIGLRPFRRNISYFGIDADQLLVNAPALTGRLFEEIGALFAAGSFVPLPYRAFDFDEIGSAFRLMQNAGHIGKIVVRPPVSGKDSVAIRPRSAVKVDPCGMHLVVGGIGGFGLAAACWLVEQGARHIALCSRRGVADEVTTAAIAHWKACGVSASLHACDITDEPEVIALLATLRRAAPLRTIIHAAMVLDDALIDNLDAARNRPVIDTKAKGATLLDRLTRSDALDHFILFSSATTMVGNPGQSNYVAANGFLEGLARARRSEGLPALAVGFGAIADAGYLAQNAAVGDRLAKRIGKTAMRATAALDWMADYIRTDPGTVDAAVVMIADIDWAAARALPVATNALFEVALRSADQHSAGADGVSMDLVAMIEGKTAQEAEDILTDLVIGEIAAILRVSRDTISRNKILKEIGLDSLMAVELGLNFKQTTGFDMPLGSVAETTTVGDVARRLHEKVSKKDQGGGETDEDDVQRVSELAQRHMGQADATAKVVQK